MTSRVAAVKSVAERTELGKRARRECPRSSHAELALPAGRDPIGILERQAASRVPELNPIRYARMLASSFAFFRGAAAVMATDLAATPRSGLTVQACGDAHLGNFGAYAAPDRRLVFDINDFDETLPGPWEWDLKRLCASFEVAAREQRFEPERRREVVLAEARTYRETVRRLAGMSNLDVWFERMDVAELRDRWAAGADEAALRRVDRTLEKARGKTRLRALAKLTHRVDGELRIISDPPVVVPVEELAPESAREAARARFEALVASYRASLAPAQRHLLSEYRFVHAARKVVGVGSVGTRAWIALFVGRDEDDPLFLQVKEAQCSVLEPFAAPSEFEHQGQRVVEGQLITQAASDILLGWFTATGLDGSAHDFYVRQLWDEKGSARYETMSPAEMTAYAQMCGATLARAHARSGDRIAIAAYAGSGATLDEAIADFAAAYADQNERDYTALAAAVKYGRVTAAAAGA